MKAIIGQKVGMTQVYTEDGAMYPVTVVYCDPNVVTQVKTSETDGYNALQIGYEDKKESKANKCEKGIFKKAGVTPKRHLIELKGDELMDKKVGETLSVEMFKAGDIVDVIGTSKGKGYTGTIKAYHHAIGPKGHGSGYHRGSGSFANNGRTNNRVIPGKKMPGRRGNHSVTIQNLLIVEVDASKNVILVKGAIPGPKKSLVTIRSAIKTQSGSPVEIKPLLDRRPKVEEKAAETTTEENA